MTFFLAGLALLIAVILGARLLQKADPKKLAWALRKIVGVAALALATFLTVRGALPIAIPLGLFGLALLGLPAGGFGFGGASKSPGQRSQVRTEALEMALDHDSGAMEGMCLKGRFEGSALSTLSDSQLLALLDELRGIDDQGAALLEAYLDWRLPRWREGEAGEGAGEAGREEPRRRAAPPRMTPDEAYAVLGLEDGAGTDDIRRAHRTLMKKLHPDQGGSNYLAARINEAKEVLLGR